jgi:ABC-2 type transport system ATP-binding protein
VLARGRHETLIVRLPDLEAGLAALRDAGIEAQTDAGLIRVAIPVAGAATITETLAARGLYLSELRPEEISLETVFLELTEEPRDPQVAPQ